MPSMTPAAIRMRARRKRPGVLERERERSRGKHRDRREYLREWRQRAHVRDKDRERRAETRADLLVAVYSDSLALGPMRPPNFGFYLHLPVGPMPRCHYCEHVFMDIFDATVDRVIPGKQGGRYERGNMVLACLSCNSSKGDRRPDEWPHPRWYEPGYENVDLPF